MPPIVRDQWEFDKLSDGQKWIHFQALSVERDRYFNLADDLVTGRAKKVTVRKKKRGGLDKKSGQYILNQALHSILSNLLSVPTMTLAAAVDGEFTWWLVWMGLANAILGPVQMLFQKLGEKH